MDRWVKISFTRLSWFLTNLSSFFSSSVSDISVHSGHVRENPVSGSEFRIMVAGLARVFICGGPYCFKSLRRRPVPYSLWCQIFRVMSRVQIACRIRAANPLFIDGRRTCYAVPAVCLLFACPLLYAGLPLGRNSRSNGSVKSLQGKHCP